MSTRWEQEGPSSGPVVSGFSGGGFKVDGQVYDSVIMTPTGARSWAAPAVGALSSDDLGDVPTMAPLPEFILLGTGATLVRPPRVFVESLEARGIGVEPMDSRAAARAWSVLRSEDRWIAAALMPL